MACIKSVNRLASVALSLDAPYLAAGTMAGAVDLSFSTSAHIEIFNLDFQPDDQELPLLGQSTSSERFNRLSWGKNGSNSEELGLIAGGLIDGKIGISNPNVIIGPESSADPLVAQLARHNGMFAVWSLIPSLYICLLLGMMMVKSAFGIWLIQLSLHTFLLLRYREIAGTHPKRRGSFIFFGGIVVKLDFEY